MNEHDEHDGSKVVLELTPEQQRGLEIEASYRRVSVEALIRSLVEAGCGVVMAPGGR